MIKCYARLFGLAVIFFFLGTLAANLNMLEGADSILEGLFTSLLFGAVFALIFGTIHIRKVRGLAGDKRAGDIYAPAQASELRLAIEYNRAFPLLMHYLKEVAGYKILGSDQIAGKISARTPLELFKTMGNNISAGLRAEGGGTIVTLRSAPMLISGIPDYGSALKTILDAEKFLRSSEQR